MTGPPEPDPAPRRPAPPPAPGPSSAAGTGGIRQVRHEGPSLASSGVIHGNVVINQVVPLPRGRWRDRAGRTMVWRRSRYQRKYLRWVLDTRCYMESKGLATVGDFTPRMSEVFVDVSLVQRAPHQISASVLGEIGMVDVSRRVPLWDFLDGDRPRTLAVIGGPGSGKTTLLHYAQQRVARESKGRRRGIPVLLELRDHAARIADDPQVSIADLVRSVVPRSTVPEPLDWFEHRLARGQCVVMLDGLDEVADARDRRRVSAWIRGQLNTYPDNDFVISSRPHGYLEATIDGAEVLQVLTFTDEQVSEFLHKWYRTIERRATGTTGPEIEVQAERRAADLLERLAANPALHALTINPLLLTMIANVHRYRNALPNSRCELYSEMCQAMLWRRNESKNLPLLVAGRSKQRILAQLAYSMMRRQVRDIGRRDLFDELAPGLRRLPDVVYAEDFVADIGDSGLLVEREREVYAFAHLTFQEYLAAQHIKDSGPREDLDANVGEAWWRETTVLYAASADADRIVRRCLSDGSVQALSLAYECAEVAADLAPALREELEQKLAVSFRSDAPPQHRQLVAGVLLTRHLRRFVYTPFGSRLFPLPVSTALYWLFRQETGTPAPDGPPSLPEVDTAVKGVRREDAVAFVAWANRAAGASGELYRLPTHDELSLAAGSDGLTARTVPAAVTGAWTLAGRDARLWYRGRTHPHRVTAGDIHRGVWADVRRSSLFTQLISLYLRYSLTVLAQDLQGLTAGATELARGDRYALVRGLAGHADSSVADLFDRNPDLGLATQARLASAQAAVFELRRGQVRVFPLDRAVAIAHAVDRAKARTRAASLHLARATSRAGTLAVELRRTTQRERIVDLAKSLRQIETDGVTLKWELEHVRELAGPERSDQPLNRQAALDRIGSVGRVDQLAGRRLGQGLAMALSQEDQTTDRPIDIFSAALLGMAAVAEDATFTTAPDRLAPLVRGEAGRFIMSEFARPWSRAVATRLVETAEAVFTRRAPVTAQSVTAIRLPAVILAAEAEEHEYHDLAAAFQAVAAGVTLLARRASDNDGEVLLLARA